VFGEEPKYKSFGKVITEHEAEHGDLPGLYRDNRGSLYHPHLRQTIPLGTLSVEGYERPAWTFNKILYSEKEGFFSILQDERWPERRDCALLTSKGFASRAARDVIDQLGETAEPLTFFCIHDADDPGTIIYQALQDATRARPGRKVEIVNLGLDPEEALRMGLPVEPVQREGGKRVAVADYIPRRWAAWLQSSRVELNAMTTPAFLAWLDAKFDAHAEGKLVPPPDVLCGRLEATARGLVTGAITERVLREADLDGQVAAAMAPLVPRLAAEAERLRARVDEDLGRTPHHPWTVPVDTVAEAVVDDWGAGELPS